MEIHELLALLLCIVAIIFGIGGIIGLFRFSDPYGRLQGGALLGTTSVFTTFLAALLLSPNKEMFARILIIIIFFLFSAPTGSSIVGRFIWQSDAPPEDITHKGGS